MPYNLSFQSPISKLKYLFGRYWRDLSSDVFLFEYYDWSKTFKIDETKGYNSLAFFSENGHLDKQSLIAYNFCLDSPISKLKYALDS